MDKLGFNPDRDVSVIKQGFTMDPFLAGQMDAASAMTYNEYQVVLASGLKPEELNVIDYNKEGVGMLQDNLFTSEETLKNKKELATRFVRAGRRLAVIAATCARPEPWRVLSSTAVGHTIPSAPRRGGAESR